MKRQPSANEAFTKLMELCSHRERSSYDIRKKLYQWGLEEQAEKIIQQLQNESYINDTRFARAYTIDKCRFNKWGRIKIRYMLKKQEFDKDTIEKAVSEIDALEYRNMVFSELNKKKKSLKSKDPWKGKAKIYTFANQRGYEMDLVNEFLESV